MPIYDIPARELLKRFVQEKGIGAGQTFTKGDIMAWFRSNYPKIKPATVQAQTTTATTNNKTRVYYNADARHDLFFQTPSGALRLYDPATDPIPIYAGGAVPDSPSSQDEDEEEPAPEIGGEEFAYESDLKNYLAANPNKIEPGLRLFDKIEGLSGVEFPVGGRYVDILAVDRQGDLVVVELKVSHGYDRVIGQLLRYMAWVEQHIAAPGQRVRGIIIARSISEDLILACSKIEGVALYEYALSISLSPVPISQLGRVSNVS